MQAVAGKINNIQALRAFAAVSVAYFHTGYSLAGLGSFGSFGVHIFFVISGFLMAGLCQGDTSGFFRRRLIRILPPYWAATLAVFAIAMARPAVLTLTRPSWEELAKSLFFIPYVKGGQAIQPMLFLGWTLNYEMFFYLLLALALSLVSGKRRALLVAGGVVAATVAVSTVFVETGVAARFYANPIQLEFVIGMAVFRCYERVPQRAALRYRGWLLAGVGASGGALIWASVSGLAYSFPVFAAASTVMVWSGCLLAKALIGHAVARRSRVGGRELCAVPDSSLRRVRVGQVGGGAASMARPAIDIGDDPGARGHVRTGGRVALCGGAAGDEGARDEAAEEARRVERGRRVNW